MAKSKTSDRLMNDLGRVFDDTAAALEAIEQRVAEERERFRQALASIERLEGEADALRTETADLRELLIAADLDGDEEEKGRLRERRKELTASLESVEEELQQAENEFGGADPWQARSIAYQKASREAEAVVRGAKTRRDELAKELDRAYKELEETAERVHRVRRAHAATRGA